MLRCLRRLSKSANHEVWGQMDFFLAGYPKCGTTALYTYLNDHPETYFPEIKEPHYFSADLVNTGPSLSLESYEGLYLKANRGQLRGDASASTIHSSVALDRILAFNPSAKFVLLLRNPVAAARSFHGELLYNLNEDEQSFERAWRLQGDRAAGRAIPNTCREPWMLQYAKVFEYRSHLPTFYEKLPESQRLTLIFEEFFENPAASYRNVLDFLNLRDDRRVEFGSVNGAKQLRSRRLASLHDRVTSRNGALYRTAKRALSTVGVHPSHLLSRFNVAVGRKQVLSNAFRAELATSFHEDVKAAERALGRKISVWDV